MYKIFVLNIIYTTYIINLYCQETRPFILRGEEITSAEITTQSDPNSMLIYGLWSLPLLTMERSDSTKHAAYTDDLSCVEKLKNMLT